MSNKIISAKNFIIQKMEHFPNGVPPTPEDVENWIEEYSKTYAKLCSQASLEKASEKTSIIENETSYVKQSEINIEENMILL